MYANSKIEWCSITHNAHKSEKYNLICEGPDKVRLWKFAQTTSRQTGKRITKSGFKIGSPNSPNYLGRSTYNIQELYGVSKSLATRASEVIAVSEQGACFSWLYCRWTSNISWTKRTFVLRRTNRQVRQGLCNMSCLWKSWYTNRKEQEVRLSLVRSLRCKIFY